MSYCVIETDQRNTNYDRVRSKHRTKRLALKKISGRRHHFGKRVIKCPTGAKKGTQIPKRLWRKKRR